jgi:hypothetical protein
MTALAAVAAHLRAAGTRFALIGAGALAVHGVTRSTRDLDLEAAVARRLDALPPTPAGSGPGSSGPERAAASADAAGQPARTDVLPTPADFCILRQLDPDP